MKKGICERNYEDSYILGIFFINGNMICICTYIMYLWEYMYIYVYIYMGIYIFIDGIFVQQGIT